MSANELQALLRFLSQDAKVALPTAMGQVTALRQASLDSPEKLAKAKPDNLKSMFPDDKVAKQIITAAKRVTKKRAAGGDNAPPPPTKKRKESLFADEGPSLEDLEASVALPTSTASEEELAATVIFTNRAPLVLAFTVILLKHTMLEQPPSSRLSLAQAYVSTTSRSRAVSLGLETGPAASEEGFGEGQPAVTIMGKELKVLRRWGYEWQGSSAVAPPTSTSDSLEDIKADDPEHNAHTSEAAHAESKPALWALDLEALKKSNNKDPIVAKATKGTHSILPIYTPQSARAYLLKSFDAAPASDPAHTKKTSAAARAAEKERNLGKLLHALDLLYASWASTLTPEDLDKRTWGWYVKVRPAVADGVAGWGGKNKVMIADILSLRRQAT